MSEEHKQRGTHSELDAQVAAHPFFIGLKREHIGLLGDCAMATHFERDHVIFSAGETANRFYLIERGRVILEAGDERNPPVVIDTIGDGDLLGWSWIFPPYKWHFAARATEPTPRHFFLRHHPARILRTRSSARLRALQTYERSDDETIAARAHATHHRARAEEVEPRIRVSSQAKRSGLRSGWRPFTRFDVAETRSAIHRQSCGKRG